MNLVELENTLSAKTGAIKEFPFGKEAMVFKVINKMFAFC